MKVSGLVIYIPFSHIFHHMLVRLSNKVLYFSITLVKWPYSKPNMIIWPVKVKSQHFEILPFCSFWLILISQTRTSFFWNSNYIWIYSWSKFDCSKSKVNLFSFLNFDYFHHIQAFEHEYEFIIFIFKSHLNTKFYLKLITNDYSTYICLFLSLPIRTIQNFHHTLLISLFHMS